METLGHDSDNGKAFFVQSYHGADQLGVGAEAPLPKRMAQDYNGGASRPVFLREKTSSPGRASAKHGEEVPGHANCVDALQLAFAPKVNPKPVVTVSGHR